MFSFGDMKPIYVLIWQTLAKMLPLCVCVVFKL